MKTQAVVIMIATICLVAVTGRSEQGFSPEKKKLVRELLDVTGAKGDAEKMADSVLKNLEIQFRYTMLQALMLSAKPDAAKQKDLEKQVAESRDRFEKKFRERFAKEVNVGTVAEEVAFYLYGTAFTESELKDLIAFYKTPTGKKAFQAMPQVLAESAQRTAVMINPKILKMVKEITEQEKKRLGVEEKGSAASAGTESQSGQK